MPVFAFESLVAVVRQTSYLLVVHLLLGMLMGFPSSHMPTLQNATFGEHAFVSVGIFGGVKGFLSILTGPGIGMFSDTHGRREALALALLLGTLPTVCMALFDSFWSYYVVDALVGIYSGAISVVMACVADTLQLSEQDNSLSGGGDAAATAQQREELTQHGTTFAVAEELVRRTRAMSIAMAALGLGYILATIIGEEISYANAFRCACVSGLAATAFVWWYLRTYLDCLSAIARANAIAASEGSGPNVNVGVYGQQQQQAAQDGQRRTGAALALDMHDTAQQDDGDGIAAANDPHASVSAQQQQQTTAAPSSAPNERVDDDDDESALVNDGLLRDPLSANAPKQQEQQRQQQPTRGIFASPAADRVLQSSQQYLQTVSRSVRRSQRTLRTYTGLRYLAGIVFCDSLITQAMAVLIPLYLKEALDFNARDQMWMTVMLGVSGFVGLLVVIPFLTAHLETMGMLRVALVADMVCVCLYAVVHSKLLAQLLPLCTVLGIAMFPCASSLASEVMFGSTAAEGLAQGIVSAARMLAEGVSPLLLGTMLSWFRGSKVEGLPFLLTGLVELVALVLSQRLVQFQALPSAWKFVSQEELEGSPSPSAMHSRTAFH